MSTQKRSSWFLQLSCRAQRSGYVEKELARKTCAAAIVCGNDLSGRTAMRRFMALAGLAIAACLDFADGAIAQQAYPTRTVKFIMPYGAASASDITARLFADRLSARWGKPVVVENRPGGDGIVSVQAFVNAADDHTLWFGPAGIL